MTRLLSRWLVVLCVLLTTAAAAGCGGSAAPTPTAIVGASSSPSPTPSPTPTPIAVDPCIVGAWKATGGKLQQRYNGDLVVVSGGAGAVTTYHADGSYNADFSKVQPYTGTTADGHRLALAPAGATSGTFTASAGQLELVSTQTTLTVTETVDGKVTSSQKASRTSSAQYTCTAGPLLTLSTGGFATQYAPAG